MTISATTIHHQLKLLLSRAGRAPSAVVPVKRSDCEAEAGVGDAGAALVAGAGSASFDGIEAGEAEVALAAGLDFFVPEAAFRNAGNLSKCWARR